MERRLVRQPIAPPPLALPALSAVQQEQSDEETEPEELVSASSEGGDEASNDQLHA